MSTPSPLSLPAVEVAQEWLEARAGDGLTRARALVDVLRADPPTTTAGVLAAWDEISLGLSDVGALGSLMSNVHPLESVREAAEQAEQDVMRLVTELSLDGELYAVFSGLDASGLDDQAARLLRKTLEDFRRAGVDQDEATRARITAINERLTQLDQAFGKHVRDDVRTVRVAPERLDGLPADWLAEHPAEADGLVTVTTDYPDAVPVRMFAHDAGVREEMTVAFLTRGYPRNEPLLHELFALRHELATLVGHDDWASYDAAVKMIGEGPAIPAFIDRIAEAAEEPMRRDLAVLLERYQRDEPGASAVRQPDASYYEEVVRREQLEVDAQQVRTYFDFAKVRQGLLDVTGRLFGLHYEPVPDAAVWAEDVTCYDVHDARAGDDDPAAPGSCSAGSTSTCTRARASTSTRRSSP